MSADAAAPSSDPTSTDPSSTDPAEATVVSPPSEADLAALPRDDWAMVLTAIRKGLHELEDRDVTPHVQRFRASPTGKLAGGRLRRDLCKLIAGGGAVWIKAHEQLAAADLPERLQWLVTGEAAPAAEIADAPTAAGVPAAQHQQVVQERDRAKERLKEARAERDEAQKKLQGLQGRIQGLENDVTRLTEERDQARATIERMEREAHRAELELDKAVNREARRWESRVTSLEADLHTVRGELEVERKVAIQEREARERAVAAAEAKKTAAPPVRLKPGNQGPRAEIGRPSRLPVGMSIDSAAGVRALMNRGRLIIIDGYNVTKTHKDGLSLEQQRKWLLQHVATFMTKADVEVRVVFDGSNERAQGAKQGNLSIHFSTRDMLADDEIAFQVAALDPELPVMVVTNDNGLRERLQDAGVDLVRTGPFLAATR